MQSILLLLRCKIIEIFEIIRDLGFIKPSLFTSADELNSGLPSQNNISRQIMAQKPLDCDKISWSVLPNNKLLSKATIDSIFFPIDKHINIKISSYTKLKRFKSVH